MISTTFMRMIALLLGCNLLVIGSSAFLLNRPTYYTSASSFQANPLSSSNCNHRHPHQASVNSRITSTTNISNMQGLRPPSSTVSNTNNSNNTDDIEQAGSIVRIGIGIRNRLRQMTGFSISALRASLRVSTGFSLTAVRLALRGFTGGIVTKTMKQFTAIFPSWVRYFMQPFLILYFTPIMILKSLCDRPKHHTERLASHQNLLNGWKNAVRRAERVQNGDYWPVHVNARGDIEAVEPPSSSNSDSNGSSSASVEGTASVAIEDAIVDSVNVSLTVEKYSNSS